MKRGEVRWFKFSHPDKKRPVVILTRDSAIEYLGEVSVAPVITTIRDIPSFVPLSKKEGMDRDCAINCDRIQTVTKSKLGSVITLLDKTRLGEVSKAAKFALGFDA